MVVNYVDDTGAALEDLVNLPATLNLITDLPRSSHLESSSMPANRQGQRIHLNAASRGPWHRRHKARTFTIKASKDSNSWKHKQPRIIRSCFRLIYVGGAEASPVHARTLVPLIAATSADNVAYVRGAYELRREASKARRSCAGCAPC